MTSKARVWIYYLIVFAVMGGLIWFQYSLWAECRSTNSFFYCLRVLNK